MTAPATVNGLQLRRSLGRGTFRVPQPFGPDGWRVDAVDGGTRVIVSTATHDDGREWTHASISHPRTMPTYEELVALHRAVWGDGWAYQVFAPPSDHVNLHPYALHLWGLADGSPVLPNFGSRGTI